MGLAARTKNHPQNSFLHLLLSSVICSANPHSSCHCDDPGPGQGYYFSTLFEPSFSTCNFLFDVLLIPSIQVFFGLPLTAFEISIIWFHTCPTRRRMFSLILSSTSATRTCFWIPTILIWSLKVFPTNPSQHMRLIFLTCCFLNALHSDLYNNPCLIVVL